HDRARLGQCERLSACRIVIDDNRDQPGRIELEELRGTLLALGQVDFVSAIGEPCLLERDGRAQAVGGGSEVQIDHPDLLGRFGSAIISAAPRRPSAQRASTVSTHTTSQAPAPVSSRVSELRQRQPFWPWTSTRYPLRLTICPARMLRSRSLTWSFAGIMCMLALCVSISRRGIEKRATCQK